jgi:hypothetical protein
MRLMMDSLNVSRTEAGLFLSAQGIRKLSVVSVPRSIPFFVTEEHRSKETENRVL